MKLRALRLFEPKANALKKIIIN